MNKKDIEKRLIDFSCSVLNIVKQFPVDPINICLVDQIIRSASSCSLNYGEAQSAESRKDFIHKSSIVLKELRETHINLNILVRMNGLENDRPLMAAIRENDELIAIFYKTIRSTRRNSN